MESKNKLSRRQLMAGATAATTITIVAPHVLGGPGRTAPSDKLNVAGVGIGGKGYGDIRSVPTENVVALCDVDERQIARSAKTFPKAKTWVDYRQMLEKQKDIDAVMIATPDHTHAVIAMAAIKLGKHVFCQKPLAHSVYECRMLGKAAKEAKVATQLGNQAQASEGARLVAEYIHAGAIGNVREIHAWSNRPHRISPRGIRRPKETPPVPKTLNWDLWLGPAPQRPYHPCYLPFRWRGWWDFGTGVLGDIGCHELSAIFKALKLGHPSTVESCTTNFQEPAEVSTETAPLASVTRYEFPADGKQPALTLTWYDGGMRPPRPPELEPGRRFAESDGILYVGDKGKMFGHRLIPEKRMKEFPHPPKTLPRSPGHYREWLAACKGGKPAGSDFVHHAAHLAEVVLLGVAAVRANRKLIWDPTNLRVTNCDEANRYIHPPYRKGWSL